MPKAGCVLVIEFVLPDVVDRANLELEFRLAPVNERPKYVGRHRRESALEVSVTRQFFSFPLAAKLFISGCR